jgi:hypothetical protein
MKEALRAQLDGAAFRKSTKSDNSGPYCVEVADVNGGRIMRDSQDPTGPALFFTEEEFDAFADGVRRGEFNRS